MNKVILMGHLVADPELKYTTSNIPVCRFRIAVNRPFVKQGEERQADFFRLVAWRSTGEFVNRFFKKGSRILIEGYLRNNIYDDNQGVRHYTEEIHVDNVHFTESKRDDTNAGAGGFTQQPSYNKAPAQQEAPAQQPESGDGFFQLTEDDDDLPF